MKEFSFTIVRAPARRLGGTWLFNNCLRMSATHTADSAVQPVLCFPRCMAWVACFKTKIMAAPTTILLACCLFVGGIYLVPDREKVPADAPCAISHRPSATTACTGGKIIVRPLPVKGAHARVYSGPSRRSLPAHALQSLRQADICQKTQG